MYHIYGFALLYHNVKGSATAKTLKIKNMRHYDKIAILERGTSEVSKLPKRK